MQIIQSKLTHWIHLAVADGPNHSPGCLPHAEAPCCTNLCIENGALVSSANNLRIRRSSSSRDPRRHSVHLLDRFHEGVIQYFMPLPNRKINKAFARRLCPDRIIHPHPVSDVNPP